MARKSTRQTMLGAAAGNTLRMQRAAIQAATEAATVAAEAVMKSWAFGESALGVRRTLKKRRGGRKTVRRKRR